MAREFKETAHTKTDMKKYGDNYDKIFGKKKKEESSDNEETKTDKRDGESA